MKHLFLISFFILVTSNAAGQALTIKSIVAGQVRDKAEPIKQQDLNQGVVNLYINGLPFAKHSHDYTMIPPFVTSNMSFEGYIDDDELPPIEKFR